MNPKFDVVIIGSGLGGLECGVILSKEGYNVCVLEQGEVFGGCLQSFSRRGRLVDTGIHYLGSMGEGQTMRQYLKYFGIFDKLSIVKLAKDFDAITLGDEKEYVYKTGYEAFRAYFTELFPREKEGIGKYCDKIREIGTTISPEVHRSGKLSSGGIGYLGISAAGFIGECVKDPLLQNLLAGTNVLYGGVKEMSNLYHHSMINHSNIEGSYRFVGGTQNVADLLVEQIRSNGGTVLSSSKVVSIGVDNADVKHVQLDNGEIISGRYFISDIHPSQTFAMLEQTPLIKKAYKSRLSLLPNTYGLFSVYLIMKPESFEYINSNRYYYYSRDSWDTVCSLPDLKPRCVMLSTQLREKESRHTDVVTLMSPINMAPFEQWRNRTHGHKNDAYHDLKGHISENMIDFVARFHPSLRQNIEASYSASPLTYIHYTGTPEGSAYGILKDYRNPLASLLPSRTKLSNLFLTGQNLNVHGALGVTLTAAATCSELLGEEYLAKKIGRI